MGAGGNNSSGLPPAGTRPSRHKKRRSLSVWDWIHQEVFWKIAEITEQMLAPHAGSEEDRKALHSKWRVVHSWIDGVPHIVLMTTGIALMTIFWYLVIHL